MKVKGIKPNNWVVCFSGYWSDQYIYGIGNTILKFHDDGHSILWINSIPNRNPSIKRAGTKKKLINNMLHKVKKHLIPIRRKHKGFFIFSPFYFPFVENPYFYKLNLKILKLQINLTFLLLGIRKGFILISSSMVETPALFKRDSFRIYFQYIADLYSDYREANEKLRIRLRKRESKIFNYATFNLVSSNQVVKKVREIVKDSGKIIYFPHGVDYLHFSSSISKKLPGIKKPIVGYFGSLTQANNQSVIIDLAVAGFSVVLIGKVTGDYDECKYHSNVHFLGDVNYSDLPSLAANFDVAFMAWKPGEWIENSNPKKSLEYLALGLPIVSQAIPQLKHEMNDLVYFADSSQEFIKQVQVALAENSSELIQKRMQRAEKEDWSNRYMQLKTLIYA